MMIARGQGSRVWDEEGREYIDYLIGCVPMLLGHGHPEVAEAALEQPPGDETLFDIHFTDASCRDYSRALHRDPQVNTTYNATLRRHGVLKSPGKLDPSRVISEDDLALTENTVHAAVASIS